MKKRFLEQIDVFHVMTVQNDINPNTFLTRHVELGKNCMRHISHR